MIVVDASVLVGALADPETDGERARRRLLEASELNAPCHVDLEVLSALARAVRRRLIDSIRATSAVADLGRITLRRYPVSAFVDRAWALRDSVTLYDAAYVALAEVLGAPLVTFDRRLAGAPGLECTIEVLGQVRA